MGLGFRVYGFTRVPVECFLRVTSFEGSRGGFLRAVHVQGLGSFWLGASLFLIGG